MPDITIVSLGPGSRDMLTLGTMKALTASKNILLRTGLTDAAEYIREQGISFDTLDRLHETCEDFDELTEGCVQAVLQRAQAGPLLYAVPDATTDESVSALISRTPCRILPGLPAMAPFLNAYHSDNVLIQPASSLCITDTQHDLIITELDNKYLAGECKLQLLNWYDPEDEILFFDPSEASERSYRRIPLADMDRQTGYDHTCACLLPALPLEKRHKFDFYDLVRIMRILRAPDGCPWDREQTHTSLRPYLIEESYETADAIDREDWADTADELGDVLLQVVYHAAIGMDDGSMDLSDITSAVCRKMIHRHPHVFGETKCATPEEVTENWNRIKQQDRGEKRLSDTLDKIPHGMEPMLRAFKVQRKIDEAGIPLAELTDIVTQTRIRADRVIQSLTESDTAAAGKALGDLLFHCINAIRSLGMDCGKTLQNATDSFISCFSATENAIISDRKLLNDLTISEIDVYWKSCKQRISACDNH